METNNNLNTPGEQEDQLNPGDQSVGQANGSNVDQQGGATGEQDEEGNEDEGNQEDFPEIGGESGSGEDNAGDEDSQLNQGEGDDVSAGEIDSANPAETNS